MKNILCLLFLFVGIQSYAQQIKPVTWSFEIIEDDGTQAIKATATMDDKWVVYSPYTDEGGPIPTSISLEDVELVGAIREEGTLHKEYSELFEINVAKFKNEVSFIQAFKSTSKTQKINGYVRFMTCNGFSCLPPKNIEFSLEP